MRVGGCSTLQQSLTVDAANVVKQAVNLARRRGHAQVTPLHVGNAMLLSSTGLLRTACLQSHSHPLQCKALELCFNVALNRLPVTSASSPLVDPHVQHLTLSNALVATFKRAQAHQRRGSNENQQQPLLATKVELEQLLISILDDPSVSRVMREAGFSSTQVKSNIEQAISLEICSSSTKAKGGDGAISSSPLINQSGDKATEAKSEEVMCVMDNLGDRRKRSIVILGECLASSEIIVKGVADRIDKEDVPEALQYMQLISFPLFSYRYLSREDVEQKLEGVRSLVNSCVGKGVILYLGDLKWAAELMASEMRGKFDCPQENMLMEIGRLACGLGEDRPLRLLGIANYSTYVRCRQGHPSLESVLCLHPLSIPTGSLGFGLSPDHSDSPGQLRNSSATGESLGYCTVDDNYGKEKPLNGTQCNGFTTNTSALPSWLQQYYKEGENNCRPLSNQECLNVKKWNSLDNSFHKNQHHLPDKTLIFSSISPCSSLPISSHDQHYSNLHQTCQTWSTVSSARHTWKEHHFPITDTVNESFGLNAGVFREPKQVYSSNLYHNTSPGSASSSNKLEMEYFQRFKELSAENLKTLCNALVEKVPWQQSIINEIASTILKCRAGMAKRKGNFKANDPKVDTWLLFQGSDIHGKANIARELASLIFGSHNNFISIGSSSFSSPTRLAPAEDFRCKRSRDESSSSYLESFADAMGSDPHRVFLMEDIEQLDKTCQMSIKSAIEGGVIRKSNGDEVGLCDAIVILCSERLNAKLRAFSPIEKRLDAEEEKTIECKNQSRAVYLDLNISIEDMEGSSFDSINLVECVHGRFIFKMQED